MLIDRPIAPPAQPNQAIADLSLPSGFPSPLPTYDVVIVGGGIVGLVVAAALRHSGLRLAVIEALPEVIEARQAQAYAFSLGSARIFQALGLWDRIRPELESFETIALSDCDWPDVVTFRSTDLPETWRGRSTADQKPGQDVGYVAEHLTLLRALKAVVKEPSVNGTNDPLPPNPPTAIDWFQPAKAQVVSWPTGTVGRTRADRPASHGEPDRLDQPDQPDQTDQSDQYAELLIQAEGQADRRIRARLIVAADGSSSPLRQAAGLPVRGWAYWQTCIVAAVKPERSHENIAYERFQTSGPFAILPLRDTCRIVWTANHAEAEAMMALPEREFLAELSRRYGPQMGQLELLGKRHTFRVKLSQCDHYIGPRLALVGEAAHTCHPVGGQGLNLGIRDAAALAELIQRSIAAGESLADPVRLQALLTEYDRWRRWENWLILGFTDLLDRFFSTQVLPIVWVRRFGIFGLKRIQPLKTLALRLMTGGLGRIPQLNQPH